MSNAEIINELIKLGKIPNNSYMSDDLFRRYDTLLQSFNERINCDDGEKLITLFSDDCDDLNWALLHIIETAFDNTSKYSDLILKCSNKEWREILQARLNNARNK